MGVCLFPIGVSEIFFIAACYGIVDLNRGEIVSIVSFEIWLDLVRDEHLDAVEGAFF